MDHFLRPGLRFEVVDSGPADAPAVVLLHGFPQQPSTFDAVAAQLNTEGLRTLAPTQRGYSRTARPSRRRDYRTAATADDVIALLDTAGLSQAHIVGHDWGGNQAWGAAGWHPDRIASLSSFVAFHQVGAYSAAKTAIVSLTRTLACEWAKDGIRVNAIAPGVFPTDLNRSTIMGTPRGQELLMRTPMGRFGQPEELVGAAVLLASDGASFLTGQCIAVDGGYLALGVNS